METQRQSVTFSRISPWKKNRIDLSFKTFPTPWVSFYFPSPIIFNCCLRFCDKNTMSKKPTRGGKGGVQFITSGSQSNTEEKGTRGRSLEAGAWRQELSIRGCRGALPTALLFVVCSTCFVTQLRPSCWGVALPDLEWTLQSIINQPS